MLGDHGRLRVLRHLRRGKEKSGKHLPMSVDVAILHLPSFETAVRYARAAPKPGQVGVVIAASAYHVGGAFLSAKHRGPEEEACIRSTLFPLLRLSPRDVEGEDDKDKDGPLTDARGKRVWVPEDGALVCEGVRVLRDSAERGFAMLGEGEVIKLTVLAISLPNLGPCYATAKQGIQGPPLGGMVPSAYEKRVRQKFETVLQGAASAGVRTLVFSDEGCEDLTNDPEDFGYILGGVLANTRLKALPEIVAAGSSMFGASVRAGVAAAIESR